MYLPIPQILVETFFIVLPIAVFIGEWYMIANGIEIEARVLRVESKMEKSGSRRMFTCRAIFSYIVDEKVHEVPDPVGATFPIHEDGAIVKILYLKNNPKRIMAKGKSMITTNTMLSVFIIIGIITIVSGL